IHKKQPELRENNSWILHHENAPSHTSILVRKFLTKNSTNVAPHAPYSLDMAPCDFFLFSILKKPFRGQSFESIEDIKGKSLRELKAIPSIAYERCFQDWIKRWHM
ncbi:hypothetical protein EAI_08895, partial [Harpegnathos saltator]